MGTRADFYVGRGIESEWIGSIAYDGYPSGISDNIKKANDEQSYRAAVKEFLSNREDRTLPSDGWPWPWDDSRTTDYAYAFDAESVWASCFGHSWFDPNIDQEMELDGDKVAIFPDMTNRPQREKFGPHSGLLVLGSKEA